MNEGPDRMLGMPRSDALWPTNSTVNASRTISTHLYYVLGHEGSKPESLRELFYNHEGLKAAKKCNKT